MDQLQRRLMILLALLVCSAFVFAADGPTLLVLNKGDASLAIVDVTTLKITGKVPTGVGPHEVATDGKLAFVANYGDQQTQGSTLSVIDLGTRKELRKVDVSPLRRPHGIAVHGGKVYFTAELNKAIARYDPQLDKVDWLLGTGQEITHMLVLDKDASAIFTANILSDTVTAFHQVPGPRGFTATQIQVGKGPEGIDMSPDGSEVWVAHSKDGGISIIDTASNKVKETLPMGMRHSNRLKFTPNGGRVLVSDAEAGEVLVIDAKTRKVVEHVKTGGVPLGILMEPSGARAFVADAESGIAVVDLKTLKVTGKIETGAAPDGMAWVE